MINKQGTFGKLIESGNWDKYEAKISKIAANIGLNHFLKGFELGGFHTDASASGWKKRKRNKQMKKRGEKIEGQIRSVIKDRALLQLTGTLRNSIKILSQTNGSIEIGTRGIKYARIHNEGLRGKAWGKHPFTMPKREFIGESRLLNTKILNIISKVLSKGL